LKNNMNKNTPLVTVGIPIYNNVIGLERTVNRMLAQSYKNIIIIISDNCSSNDEVFNSGSKLAEKYSNVKYVRQKSNIGIWKNFTYLYKEASGKYFMWAADDDDWDDDYIQFLVEKLEFDEDVVLGMTDSIYMLDDGERLPYLPESIQYKNKINSSVMRMLNTSGLHSYNNIIYGLFRLEVLKDIGDDLFKYCSSGAHSFTIPISNKGNIIVYDEVKFYPGTYFEGYLKMAEWLSIRVTIDKKKIHKTDVDKVINKSMLFMVPELHNKILNDIQLGMFDKFKYESFKMIVKLLFYNQAILQPLSVLYHSYRKSKDSILAVCTLDANLLSKVIIVFKYVIDIPASFVKSVYISIRKVFL